MDTHDSGTGRKRASRQEIAQKLAEYDQAIQNGGSQRRIAGEIGIPRSTLQYWLARKATVDVDPAVAAFFESPSGAAFLHRLVLGAHFVMTLLGPCSVRLVCQYLELTGLDRFIASTYSPQQKVSVRMEEAVVGFGQTEQGRLADGMRPQAITICQDETFHPAICLVAIEPVSNFILLEQYAESRKADDWTAAMQEATAGLTVKIVQSTSDEGQGILHHVKQDLGAHHSPDVFHVQHELVKGTSVALASHTRQAEQALEHASEEVCRQLKEHDTYRQEPHGPGRPPAFEARIEHARTHEEQARTSLDQAMTRQERVKAAIRGVSTAYHPYDLDTGKARSAEEMATALQAHFSTIEEVASQANLSTRSLKKIQKAKKVVVDMVATLTFFLMTIQTKVDALSLVADVERAMYDNLIPGIYLHLASTKAKTAEHREHLRQTAENRLTPLRARNGPFAGLEPEERALLERVGEECAQVFQRSSSCVEGRNGQLALRHHSLQRISHRKLAALTAVHNFAVPRQDGTTAAERFFGAPPKDMFEHVLNTVELPGRPAQKRSQPTQKGYLSCTA
jgi:hypothetical protein